MSKIDRCSLAWCGCVLALSLMIAAPASAYRMIVETWHSAWTVEDGPGPGDWVVHDIYLDTEGESGITLLSFGLAYDPNVLIYEPTLSEANDYYPLYDAGTGKTQPPTWLEPAADPPALWSSTPPPVGAQVNVEFLESNLNETVATATRLYLATLTFQVISPGNPFTGGPTFNDNGNIFLAYGVDVKDSVDIEWVFVPEPGTALLVGLGLAGLAAGAARSRRGW